MYTSILGIKSHRFPNPRQCRENFDKWVEITGGDDDLYLLDSNVVYFKKRMCSVHFTENDGSPGTNSLKCNAVPSLYSSRPITGLEI